MLYCSPIGGVKGNIEAGWGRPSTAWKFLFEKMRIFKKKVFSTCDSPGQVPAASHPDSAPPSTNLQDMVVIKDVGFPNPPPKASEEGNLTRTEDDHDDGDEDVDDFDDREIVKAHKGWIKMTLSVPENI